MYLQQQELEMLREENQNIKRENDRMVKLLYDKEQAA